MTRLVIAGDIGIPDRVAPGDTLELRGTVKVYEAKHERIDIAAYGSPKGEDLQGELEIVAIAIALSCETT